MQVRDALKLSVEKFKESPTPSLDARLLLAYVMNYTQEELLINYDQELKQGIKERFLGLVERRAKHEPIAYILA